MIRDKQGNVLQRYKESRKWRKAGSRVLLGQKTHQKRVDDLQRTGKKGAVIGGLIGAASHAQGGSLVAGGSAIVGAALGAGVGTAVTKMRHAKQNRALNRQAKAFGFTRKGRMRIK